MNNVVCPERGLIPPFTHGAALTTAKKPASRRRKIPGKTSTDIWARTQLLVEVLLEVMENEIRAPENERSERWLKLFGAKDSAVVNLQKLVLLLADLQVQAPSKNPAAEVEPVNAQELAILSDWLTQINAASASPEAE